MIFVAFDTFYCGSERRASAVTPEARAANYGRRGELALSAAAVRATSPPRDNLRPPGPPLALPAGTLAGSASAPLGAESGHGPGRGRRPRIAVNTRRVLSERRRRFPQVLPDDEGGLRRETHRTAIGGDTSEHRQAAVEQAGRGSAEDAVRAGPARREVDHPAGG